MNEIEQHIGELFKDVPESGRKREIMQEITLNLNEKCSTLIKQGMPREQAVGKALEDVGDVGELKKELESGARAMKDRRNGLSLAFSIWGSVLILALTLFINFYYTPDVIWFVYPAFAVVWWPMTMFFHWLRHKNGTHIGFPYAVCGFCLIVGLMLFINLYCSPKVIWFVYPAFAAVWWPLAMLFHRMREAARKEEENDG